jgi:hypothetical protein
MFKKLIIVSAFALPASALALKVDVNHQTVELESLKDYDECQSRDYEGSWCHKALKAWVDSHPDDAFQAGKMTRAHMNHYEALPFFIKAFEAKKGDCDDIDVSRAVMAGLGLPPRNELLKHAQKLAFDICFNDLKDTLVNGVANGGYFAGNACGPLRKKGALSGQAADRCKGK